jgi:N-methylhydantoinase A
MLESAPESTRIFHGEGWIDCARHAAEALKQGQTIDGPAVIDGYTATTWVPPGWTATLDASDNLILRRPA